MLNKFFAINVPVAAALCIAGPCFGAGATFSHPKPLSDVQLDKVNAGSYVTAKGDGTANGQLSNTEVSVTTIAQSGQQSDGSALGSVTAVALSTGNSLSSASSTLSLTFSYP